jgi:hypothetical protein
MLFVLLAPRPLLAQPQSPPPEAAAASDVTTAAELFRQGRAAFDANDVVTARARLLESARLNPRVGTFISLAQCEEIMHLLASARTHWQQAADLGSAQGDSRASFAREHLTSIDARVPRVTMHLPAAAPPGTRVRFDDVELGPASLGIALPTDAGKHVVVVESPQREPNRVDLELAEGQAYDVQVDVGAALPPPPQPASTPAQSVEPPPGDPRALRIASYAVAGLGVAGIGVGTYFGLKAIDGKSVPGCTGDTCTLDGARARNDAIVDGNVSTGLFIGGGALVAAGVVMRILARSPAEKGVVQWTPAFGPREVGLAARVTFR